MAVSAKPGDKVTLTVNSTPKSESVAKTLSRIFRASPGANKQRARRREMREASTEGRQRGGRIWMVRPKAPRLYQPVKGDSCKLTLTTQIIRDIERVERHVSIG